MPDDENNQYFVDLDQTNFDIDQNVVDLVKLPNEKYPFKAVFKSHAYHWCCFGLFLLL
jgi:hypothetical protein